MEAGVFFMVFISLPGWTCNPWHDNNLMTYDDMFMELLQGHNIHI
jgi:hypothetical protein